MTLTKTDTAESVFTEFGWPNREARSGVDPSVGWGLLGKRALTRRVSVAVAGVRRFVVTLLSALLVGCGGDSDSGADTAAPQAAPLQEQILVFTQAGPLNLVVGDTLSNVASGGLGTGVIRYRSSDTTIATVDATGRLTVVGAGIATITAEKAADTQYAAARADYDVSATPVPQDPGPEPQRIGFDQPGPFNLVVGDTLSNVASGGPGTGVIRYSSSNTTVATVDATGQLTVVGAGIAMITAEKAADANYTAASASYLVQTTQASQAIGFDQPGPFHLMVGDTLRNAASGGSGTGVISYSSSNTTVATVDAAGQLTVVGIGTATITAEKAADTQYTAASASYTVTAPSRVSMTAWVGSEDTQVQVDLPLSTSGMAFFRSTEANCDLSNVANCVNGQSNIVHGGQTVKDTAFTLNQTAYYVLQHGANQASLEVSTERFRERSGHQVVVHNNRLWVIGGYDDGYKNDVWRSEDGVTWTEVARTGPRFSERTDHQVVAHNDRLWVIGGFFNGIHKNDVWWSEDGVNWEPMNNAPFLAREGHQAVSYDDWLWVIGGRDGSRARNNDVWRSKDGENWEQMNNAPFSPRQNHQVVAHNNRLWVIGGSDGSTRYNDVWWSEDGENWEKVEATNNNNAPFSPRQNHQVVAHNNRLWVIGGSDGTSFYNDVWWSEDDGKTWTDATNNADFSPRNTHQVVVHINRLWVIGGWDGDRKNDVWWSEDDGKTWTEATNSAGFSPRSSHQVVAHDNRLWVIGGWDGGRNNDVWWSKDGVTWNEVPPEVRGIEHFSARSGHQVVVHNDQLWVIGGSGGTDSYDDVWRSEDGADWTQVTNSAAFPPRLGHEVVVYDDKLWVIGGRERRTTTTYYNDVWWSRDGENWEKTDNSKDRFEARRGHQVVVHNDELWLFGGHDGSLKNDVWWSEDGENWEKVEATNKPFPLRANHQVVVHNDRLWLIGGWGFGQKNDVWRSENGADWTELTNSADFSPRQNHQVVAHNDELWLIGGYDDAQKNDVWRSEDGVNWRQGFHHVFQFQ